MSDINLLDDYVDIEGFAAEVKRDPRTVRRWMNEPEGLPFTRIGKPDFGSCSNCPGVDFWADEKA